MFPGPSCPHLCKPGCFPGTPSLGAVGGLRTAEACFVPHSAAPPHPIPGRRYLCFQAVSFCRESLRALPG